MRLNNIEASEITVSLTLSRRDARALRRAISGATFTTRIAALPYEPEALAPDDGNVLKQFCDVLDRAEAAISAGERAQYAAIAEAKR